VTCAFASSNVPTQQLFLKKTHFCESNASLLEVCWRSVGGVKYMSASVLRCCWRCWRKIDRSLIIPY
jgi:hypothetical protein